MNLEFVKVIRLLLIKCWSSIFMFSLIRWKFQLRYVKLLKYSMHLPEVKDSGRIYILGGYLAYLWISWRHYHDGWKLIGVKDMAVLQYFVTKRWGNFCPKKYNRRKYMEEFKKNLWFLTAVIHHRNHNLFTPVRHMVT